MLCNAGLVWAYPMIPALFELASAMIGHVKAGRYDHALTILEGIRTQIQNRMNKEQ